MEEMKKYILGDVCSRLSSGKGISSEEVLESGPFPVIGGNGLRGYSLKSNFSGECGVIGRQGAYCGNVRYFSGEAYMTEHAVVVVGNEMADTRYLTYLLSTMHLGNLSAQSAQPGLSVKTLAKQEIMLPSLAEQKRRASILASLEDKIALNNRINHNLQSQIRLLYRQWFVSTNEPYTERPLSEIIDFQEGPGIRNWQYVTAGGVRFINIRCINDGDVDVSSANMISSNEAYGKYSHFLLRENDIVMSCSGTLGRHAIIRKEHLPLCLNTSVIRFKPRISESDYSFVYGYLSSEEFINKQRDLACGSVQANFGPTHLKSMTIRAFSPEYRSAFNEKVLPMIQTICSLRRENDTLRQERDFVLSKLMSGEVSIEESYC